MTTLTEIETAVTRLTRKDFNIFCDWFEEQEAKRWDEHFESDVENGLLDNLAAQALADFKSGNFKEL